MKSKPTEMWKRMRDSGLTTLAQASRHAIYLNFEQVSWDESVVLTAAHAAQQLIKAKILQEQPSLIFDSLPEASQDTLTTDILFEEVQTIEWNQLPGLLQASAGITLADPKTYNKFGSLRNMIQYTTPTSSINTIYETLNFIFRVIDPLIHQCWGLFAVDYSGDYEPYTYFIPLLVDFRIPFLVSPAAAENFARWNVNWDKADEACLAEILSQVNGNS